MGDPKKTCTVSIPITGVIEYVIEGDECDTDEGAIAAARKVFAEGSDSLDGGIWDIVVDYNLDEQRAIEVDRG